MLVNGCCRRRLPLFPSSLPFSGHLPRRCCLGLVHFSFFPLFSYYSLCRHIHRMGARGVDTWVWCLGGLVEQGVLSLRFFCFHAHDSARATFSVALFFQGHHYPDRLPIYLHSQTGHSIPSLSFHCRSEHGGTVTTLSNRHDLWFWAEERLKQIPNMSTYTNNRDITSNQSIKSPTLFI